MESSRNCVSQMQMTARNLYRPKPTLAPTSACVHAGAYSSAEKVGAGYAGAHVQLHAEGKLRIRASLQRFKVQYEKGAPILNTLTLPCPAQMLIM